MKHFGAGSITLGSGAGTLQVAAASFHEAEKSDTPPDELLKWLGGLGWTVHQMSEGTKFQNNGPNHRLMGRWYTWEQATAIEFFRFLHLGTK